MGEQGLKNKSSVGVALISLRLVALSSFWRQLSVHCPGRSGSSERRKVWRVAYWPARVLGTAYGRGMRSGRWPMRIYIFNMCRCDQSSSPRRSAMIGAAAEEEQEIIFLWGHDEEHQFS